MKIQIMTQKYYFVLYYNLLAALNGSCEGQKRLKIYLPLKSSDTMILLGGKDVTNQTEFSSESKHFCLTPNKLRPHNIKTSD